MPSRRPAIVIERRERIRRPAGDVFSFFETPSNLKRVTPGGLAVSLEGHPPDLRPGTLFRYRLRRWPLDLFWEVVVSEYRPPDGFTNVKATGYFPRWALEHEVIAREDASELRMRLTYEVPSGLYARLANSYIVREAMEELLSAQIQAIRDELHRGA